jgi:lipid-A-disaccharide synthase-like uncharacterized protein
MKRTLEFLLCAVLIQDLEPVHAGQSSTEEEMDTIEIIVSCRGRDQKFQLARNGDGSFGYRIVREDGSTEWLSPEAFARITYEDNGSPGPLTHRLFNISSAAGLPWVVLGLLGQLLYTARMTVQWIASERRKKSVVPPAFWWLSLAAAGALTAYFSWRRDIVGILGNCIGGFVYVRNLCFISRGVKSERGE